MLLRRLRFSSQPSRPSVIERLILVADDYEVPFRNLLDEIQAVSPETAQKLDSMLSEFGSKVAYYAAFVIACLEVRIQQADYYSVIHATVSELSDFTFFEYVNNQPYALTLFTDLLTTYQDACRRRYEQQRNSPAAV